MYWLLVFLLISQAFGKDSIPKFVSNNGECPLDACEVLKIFSKDYFISKLSENYESDKTESLKLRSAGDSESYFKETQLEHRLADVERRLRSVEQPLWKIEVATELTWDRCTEGTCRCETLTKSLSCWRINLKSIPEIQLIPNNIQQM